MKEIKLLRSVIIILLVFGLTACSDSGVDTDQGEPPAIPQIGQTLKVDVSYFNSSTQGLIQFDGNTNYNAASIIVGANVGLLAFGEIYTGFLGFAEGKDPTFSNGVWSWEYEYSANGQTATIKLTAKENTGEGTVTWTLYVSGTELGFENYKFMEGTVTINGKSGSWSYFAFAPGGSSEAVFTFDWAVTAEDSKTLTVTFNTGDNEGTLSFTREGSVYELTLTPAGAKYTSVVHWNTDTMTGYYIDPEGVKNCWNNEFQDIPCGN